MAADELYRDPVYDGATDPLVVIDGDGAWWMFYTQRRATHPHPGPGVAWVHGSRIGVARSADGVAWDYAGTLEPAADGLELVSGPPPRDVDRTHWAPEVIHDGARWRMYLTEIDGIPDRWPGFARHIVEYVSDDLARWRRRAPLSLASDRVIDAGVAIGLPGHEGPTAFELGGWWWLIVDEWRGMGVYRSTDAIAWRRQGDADAVILGPGSVPGPGFGHHGAPVREGDRVWFYFFGHPLRAEPGQQETLDGRRCAVYRVELVVTDGTLTAL